MKTTNKKSQKQAGSYKAEILKKSSIVTNPNMQTYVRPEYHRRMEEIIALFAEEGMTVEDYLDNVLAEHFAQFRNETETSLKQNAAGGHMDEGNVQNIKPFEL